MSSPSEPEEIVSTSMERSFLPSFITEPLPNCRSIWDSAADNALLLSMEEPSTIRRAVTDIGLAPYDGDSLGRQTLGRTLTRLAERLAGEQEQCTLFVPSSQYVLFPHGGEKGPRGPPPQTPKLCVF